MIDHEFRIVTPVILDLLKKKSQQEKTLIGKIPIFITRNNYLNNANKDYLKRAKLIKGVYFRGLPINNKKKYFDQEIQLEESFLKMNENLCLNVKGNQIVQIPNPDLVSFSLFKKNLKKIRKFYGFEVIPSWHYKNINDKSYNKFLNFIQETGLPLSLEIDYFYRSSNDSIHNFFKIIQNFPNIRYWLPHLGCGIFLHWNKVMEFCKYEPILLSSTNDLSRWKKILNKTLLKNLPIKYATDHPFNGLNSLKIYKTWLKKFKVIKK